MDNSRNEKRLNSLNEVKALCSISPTGAVFLTQHRVPLTSEVCFSMETEVFGLHQEWVVRGWVVECQQNKLGAPSGYQVTLLFHDLPEGLERVLELNSTEGVAYPELQNCALFGKN